MAANDVRIVFNTFGGVDLPDGSCLGVQGEHNVVRLAITLPESMVVGMTYHTITINGIESAWINTTANNDGAYRDGNILYVPLTCDVTQYMAVDLFVTAYRQEGAAVLLVDKTIMVRGLQFAYSNLEPPKTEPGGIVARVFDNTKRIEALEEGGTGVTVVDRYADLPIDVETGTVAIVLYDDTQETAIPLGCTTEISAGTTVTPSEVVTYREDAFDALVQACVDSGSGVFIASVMVAPSDGESHYLAFDCTPLDVQYVGELTLEQTLYVRATGTEQKYAITLIDARDTSLIGLVDVAAVYVFTNTLSAKIYVDGLIGYLEQDLQAGWSVITAEFDNTGEIIGLASVRHVDSIADVFGFVTPTDYSVSVSANSAGLMAGVASTVVSVPRRGLYVKQSTGWVLIERDYSAQISALQQVAHRHDNLGTLDKIGENSDGDLTFDGKVVGEKSVDTLVPLTLGTEYDLQIRSDWTDVPIYLVAEPSYRIGLQTGESDTTEVIRVFEATDNATWVPCPIIRIKRGDNTWTYYPRTFTDISSEISAGWYDENMTATTAPSLDNMTFGALDVCGTKYTSLDSLPAKAQLALETLSRIINVSTTAMGTLGIVEDGVQRYQGVIEPNRKYAFAKGVGDATVDLPTVPWSVHDAQFVMYLTCSNDVDFSFTAGTYFSNGIAPNTGTGKHKLIGYWLKDAEAWAVGGIDYAGVS